MKKIVKIGDILLDNPLYLVESFEVKNVRAKVFETLGGSRIVFESIKRDNANNITLDSKENGWIREDTLYKIRDLANDVGVRVNLIFDDGSSALARFRYEDSPIIEAEELYEGSIWYRCKIKMAYV